MAEPERDTLVEIIAEEDSGVRAKVVPENTSLKNLLPKGIVDAYKSSPVISIYTTTQAAAMKALSKMLEKAEADRAELVALALQLKKDIVHSLEVKYLYPLFDTLKTREDTEELRPIANYTQSTAIDYCQRLIDNDQYHHYIRPATLSLLRTIFTEGDWLSKAGLKKMREEIHELMEVPIERRHKKDRDTIPDIEFEQTELSPDEAEAIDIEINAGENEIDIFLDDDLLPEND